MNDTTTWQLAVTQARQFLENPPADTWLALSGMLDTIVRLKYDLVEMALEAGSSGICRECSGECCRFGKYHLTILDVLACLKDGTAIPEPDFDTPPNCPYGTTAGCSLSAGYRPMTCAIFNCQQIEDRMTSRDRDYFHKLEQELRATIAETEKLTGQRLNQPLLLSIMTTA